MIPRTLFAEEHELFRNSVRRFVEERIVPFHDQWERDGMVSREVWLEAGEQGFLCCAVPEEYGGAGADFLYGTILIEELGRVGANGPGFHLHSDIVVPYIMAYGSEEQKRRWLPKMARGEIIGAIAMTEPAAGSDLQGIRTRAEPDGDGFVVNGQKVFISNGQMADLVIVACKTAAGRDSKGLSLVVVERGMEGFTRGRNLEKIGWKAQDTSELFFEDVRVPAENLLGAEGQGFGQLVGQLPQERLVVAIRCATVIESALDWTIRYTNERKAFERTIASFQNTRFKLAEAKVEAMMLRSFVDRCIALHLNGGLDAVDAAAVKLQSTEMLCRILDDLLQLFGGYGYMWEYPIARAWADARMARIAGGSSEIMKEIVGRSLVAGEG